MATALHARAGSSRMEPESSGSAAITPRSHVPARLETANYQRSPPGRRRCPLMRNESMKGGGGDWQPRGFNACPAPNFFLFRQPKCCPGGVCCPFAVSAEKARAGSTIFLSEPHWGLSFLRVNPKIANS